jgi:hypothetical protein
MAGKHDKADALIQLYEQYTDVALALALEGKISAKDDEQAHTLFSERKYDELSKLYHQRKRQLHKPISFLEPADALDGWKPKVYKKNASNAVSTETQRISQLRTIKGTRMHARTLLSKGTK